MWNKDYVLDILMASKKNPLDILNMSSTLAILNLKYMNIVYKYVIYNIKV